jgi:hypothetical protein
MLSHEFFHQALIRQNLVPRGFVGLEKILKVLQFHLQVSILYDSLSGQRYLGLCFPSRLRCLAVDNLLHHDQFLFPDDEVEKLLDVFVVLDCGLILLQGKQEIKVDVGKRQLVLQIELLQDLPNLAIYVLELVLNLVRRQQLDIFDHLLLLERQPRGLRRLEDL